MYWLYLSIAIVFEVLGTTAMKWSNGLTNVWATVVMIISYGVSFTALAVALKGIDVSVAYAIWSGLGIVFISLVGFFLFQEIMSSKKVMGIIFILFGVILLKTN
ncbi:multidrug efflux SMR transporter [Anoxybacillus kestanbolensis]|uniref:DMT family transporter n=1 Tax=Anoxybacillus kestanbolensis TaxID=227476 RepID=UPI00208DBA6E|nr:multidrug efflux SMR transporter [Anoxybacillus kestanbolensis]MCL9971334.1 multidrug efflux SMR transporter [Anoxybacillus kestanbolensis]